VVVSSGPAPSPTPISTVAIQDSAAVAIDESLAADASVPDVAAVGENKSENETETRGGGKEEKKKKRPKKGRKLN